MRPFLFVRKRPEFLPPPKPCGATVWGLLAQTPPQTPPPVYTAFFVSRRRHKKFSEWFFVPSRPTRERYFYSNLKCCADFAATAKAALSGAASPRSPINACGFRSRQGKCPNFFRVVSFSRPTQPVRASLFFIVVMLY